MTYFRDIEKEIGVAMRPKNLPGIPQYEIQDFLKWSQIIFEISIGDVFIQSTIGISGFGGKIGTSLSGFGTVALLAKWLFKILLFSCSDFTVLPFSIKDGIDEYFWFFISLRRIENFFFAEISGLFKVEFIVL